MDAYDPTTRLALRRRAYPLQEIIACLARQIDEGFTPIVDDMHAQSNVHAIDVNEMRRLAKLCDERNLPVEAARIRRWLNS